MLVLDLKTHNGICETSRRFIQGRSAYVYRSACVYPNYGFHAAKNLSALCCAVSGQLQCEAFHLHGSVTHHGFRTAGLSGELAGHRSLSPGAKQQALSHGHSQPSFPQHSCGSERDTGLAHLFRFCSSSDRYRQKALLQRIVSRGPRQYSLYLRCHNDRPCVSPSSPGHTSGRPRGQFVFIPCWICEAIYQALSTSPTEYSTKSTLWI